MEELAMDEEIRIDYSHVSDHFLKGNEGTHCISQQIHVGDQTMISYTDVSPNGGVLDSGFDFKVG